MVIEFIVLVPVFCTVIVITLFSPEIVALCIDSAVALEATLDLPVKIW